MPTIIKLVDELVEARQTGKTLKNQAMREVTDALSVSQAYHIAHAVTAKQQALGDKLVGYKISMTSDNTQAIFSADEPLYGQLTASQVLQKGGSHANKAEDSQPKKEHTPLLIDQLESKDILSTQTKQTSQKLMLSLSGMNAPLLELELAFIAQTDLLPTDTPEQLCQKCTVAPCLEVPDSRYQDWFANLALTQVCADGAVGGKVGIGHPVCADFAMIAQTIGQLSHNEQTLLTEPANVVLGHPAYALKWLVDKLHTQGLHIHAGMFVASGSFGMPIELKLGEYVGHFSDIGQVQLTVTP